jgi:uncharacterized protein YoxC
MTEHLLVSLVCVAVFAVLAFLIYVNTQQIDRSLHERHRVLYDVHKRISSVTKRVEKAVR